MSANEKWSLLQKTAALINSREVLREPANRYTATWGVLSGSVTAALNRDSVAILPSNLELCDTITLTERPKAGEVLLRSVLHRSPAYVMPGTLTRLCEFFCLDHSPQLEVIISSEGRVVAFGRHAGQEVVAHAVFSEPEVLRALMAGMALGKSVCPELAPDLVYCNDHCAVQTRMPGVAVRPWQLSESQLQQHILASLQPLRQLQDREHDSACNEEYRLTIQRFAEQHSRACDLAPALELVTHGPLPRNAVTVHGDYWLTNVLMIDGAVTGIVDWNRPFRGGFPCFDALHLGFMSYGMWRNEFVSDLLADLWTDQWRYPWLAQYCHNLCDWFGVTAEELRSVAALLWLSYLHWRSNASDAWTEQMIRPVFNALTGSRSKSLRIA